MTPGARRLEATATNHITVIAGGRTMFTINTQHDEQP